MYIVLEGPDGSGKTTTAMRLKEVLETQGREVIWVREPGGSVEAERIRDIVFNYDFTKSREDLMTVIALMYASRMQLMLAIKQYLSEGKVVISDRNYITTLAYQILPTALDNWEDGELAKRTYNLITSFQGQVIDPDHLFMLDAVPHDREDGNAYDDIARKLKCDDLYDTLFDMLSTKRTLTTVASHTQVTKIVQGMSNAARTNAVSKLPIDSTEVNNITYSKRAWWSDLFVDVLCGEDGQLRFNAHRITSDPVDVRLEKILDKIK